MPGDRRAALADLADWLGFEQAVPGEDRLAAIAETIQQEVYEIGKRHGFAEDLRAWFRALYRVCSARARAALQLVRAAFYGPTETIEEAESRRIRQHEAGRALVHERPQMLDVDVPPRVGLHLGQLVPGHRDARRIRSVRRVRGDDRVPVLAAVVEVGAHEHQPGQLSLRAGRGLQRDPGEARDLRQRSARAPTSARAPLGAVLLLERMEVAEAERDHALVHRGLCFIVQ